MSDEEGQGRLIRWDGLAAGPGVYHGSAAFQKAGTSLNTGPRRKPLSAYKKRWVATPAVTTGPRKYGLSNLCENGLPSPPLPGRDLSPRRLAREKSRQLWNAGARGRERARGRQVSLPTRAGREAEVGMEVGRLPV